MVRKAKGADHVGLDAGRGLLDVLTDIQTIPVLSKTAGARGAERKFLQRLNRMACIDG
jgi:hypothetical protein